MLNAKAFTREIQALTEIRHRKIVKLYGFVHIHDGPLWCMNSWRRTMSKIF